MAATNASAPLSRWPNFRDLSDVTAAAERHVRPGRFYRAPALTDLTKPEQDLISALDPGAIIDFRSHNEVESRPVRFPEPLVGRRVHLPIPPLVDDRFQALLDSERLHHDDVAAAMVECYRDFARVHGAVYLRFLQVVAEVGDRAVIFHCTAGKDRTGFAAALLLTALGAPMAAVERDYLVSGDLWQPDSTLEALLPAPARAAVFGVSPDYLRASLEELDVTHGGAAAFAEAALGDAGFRDWRSRNRIERI